SIVLIVVVRIAIIEVHIPRIVLIALIGRRRPIIVRASISILFYPLCKMSQEPFVMHFGKDTAQ
ncbi:MAG: hypothetical protein Q9M36_08300, partial [Sulfurovum sp.]|nr:hypothetical protein [Sulfurovum sp.]